MPTLSPGQIWQGPPIDGLEAAWSDDPEIVALVDRVTSRRVPITQAVTETESFAAGLGADRHGRLALLFAGVFQRINEARSDAIAAIRRYARSQRALVDTLAGEVGELESQQQAPGENAERIRELTESIEIHRRIFADRRRALRPLCEQPALLEERLGALARAAMAYLD